MTAGVTPRRVLGDETLKTIAGQIPEKGSVADPALAVEWQFYVVSVRYDVAVVACAAMTRICAKFGLRLEIFRAAVIAVFELIGIVEKSVLGPVKMKYRRRIGHAEQ